MAKGGDFTREIAKEFSLYLTQMKSEDGVWLTESSGGRATSKRKTKQQIRDDQFGDITYTISECKFFFDIFSIECKTGYAKKTKSKSKKEKDKNKITLTHWSIMDLLDSSQRMTQFHEFWNQCLNDALESKREPLLVFRRNKRTPCIAMHEDIFKGFIRKFGYPPFNYIMVTGDFSNIPIVVMNLRMFFDWTSTIDVNVIKNYIIRILMWRKLNED